MTSKTQTFWTELKTMNDDRLIQTLEQLIGNENKILAQSLAYISEVGRRRLFLSRGFTSLYEFCVKTLPLSPGSVYRRTQVAKKAQKHPLLLELVAKGELNLTVVSKICPHLKDSCQNDYIRSFIGKTVNEVEAVLLNGQRVQESPDLITRTKDKVTPLFDEQGKSLPNLAQARDGGQLDPAQARKDGPIETRESKDKKEAIKNPPQKSAPDSQPKPTGIKREKRYAIRFTASEQLKNKLQRAKEVMSHKYPNGQLEEIFEAALDELLEKNAPELKKIRKANKKCDPESPYIPRKMEKDAFAKANYRCQQVSACGRQCGSKKFLEVDHVMPRAHGGLTVSNNLQVLCKAHNLQKARLDLGSDFIDRKIRERCQTG